MRLKLGLAALVLVAAGCGGMTSSPAGPPDGELVDAPAIDAANEPVPDVAAQLQATVDPPTPEMSCEGLIACGSATICFFGEDAFPPQPSTGELKDEECDRAMEGVKGDARAHLPRAGSPPTVIATLQGAGEGLGELATWRNDAGRLCAALVGAAVVPFPNARGAPQKGIATLMCSGDAGCHDLCVAVPPRFSEKVPELNVVGGIVSAEGEYLRLSMADGRRLVYPLVGPPVEEGAYRAFIAKLPSHRVEAAELFADGQLLAEVR